jgi:hypothetical protein
MSQKNMMTLMISNTIGSDYWLCDKLHFLSFRSSQLDRLLGAADKYLALTQSVHSNNDINVLWFQDNEVGDKVHPLILRFTFGHSCLAGIPPPGELTIIWHFSRARGRLCFSTYVADMKECDALESNGTTVEVSLMRNIPMTTSGSSCISSTATWLTLPWV